MGNKSECFGNWLDRHHLGFLNLLVYVFWPHSRRETEEISNLRRVSVAEELDGLWPRPWLYSRVLALFCAAFAMLYGCWIVEGRGTHSTLMPGMTIVGALAFPVSVLIFFYECNKFRSIPLLTVLRYFLVGSCVSIALTFVFTFAFDQSLEARVSIPFYVRKSLHLWYGTIRPLYWVDSHPAIPIAIAALFEEFSKTLVIFVFMMRHRTRCYILQGMLVGAAVGAGFAVFESAGYAMIGRGDLLAGILTRGLMSPACHTAWGALIGGGTMLLTRGRLRYRLLFNPLFSALFLFVSALHFLWNFLLDTSDTLTGNLQLSAFTWFVLLMIMWAGVQQTRRFREQGFIPVEI